MQKNKLAQSLSQLEGHLLWLKEEGVRTVAADPKSLSTAPIRPPLTISHQPSPSSQPPVSKAWKSEPPKVPSLGKTAGPVSQPLEKVPVGGSSSSREPRPEAHKTREQELPSTSRTTPAAASPVLAEIAARIAVCTKCRLSQSRTRTVPGQGTPRPEIMFVGEGPGEDEDLQGLAFVGRAGQLLTRMIIRMGLNRDQVFIANIVKCRPPANRVPAPDEMAACLPYLREQVAELKPKVIVCLGATAVKGLLNNQTGITKLRGHWQTYQGVDVMPTLHPSFLLRGGGEDRARWWEVWEDLIAVLKKVGREPPPQKTAPPPS
jgi:DNA polymerase